MKKNNEELKKRKLFEDIEKIIVSGYPKKEAKQTLKILKSHMNNEISELEFKKVNSDLIINGLYNGHLICCGIDYGVYDPNIEYHCERCNSINWRDFYSNALTEWKKGINEFFVLENKDLSDYTIEDFIKHNRYLSSYKGNYYRYRKNIRNDLRILLEKAKEKKWIKVMELLIASGTTEKVAFSYILDKLDYLKGLLFANKEVNLLNGELKQDYHYWLLTQKRDELLNEKNNSN